MPLHIKKYNYISLGIIQMRSLLVGPVIRPVIEMCVLSKSLCV